MSGGFQRVMQSRSTGPMRSLDKMIALHPLAADSGRQPSTESSVAI
jgi:hypothetical protein